MLAGIRLITGRNVRLSTSRASCTHRTFQISYFNFLILDPHLLTPIRLSPPQVPLNRHLIVQEDWLTFINLSSHFAEAIQPVSIYKPVFLLFTSSDALFLTSTNVN